MESTAPTSPRRTSARTALVFAGLLAALAALFAANLAIGSLSLDAGQLWGALFAGDRDSLAGQVVWQIRLPRAVGAAVLGGALALAGFLLQTFFNNPIAGPYILGIASGAKLVVALATVVFVGARATMSSAAMVGAAFAGSLLTMGLVLLLSRHVRSRSMLIVAGVMVGYICSAATDFLVTFADDQNIVTLHNWGLGSFSGIGWGDVGLMAAVVGVAAAASFCLAKPIGAYQMGEAYARSVGVNVAAFRVALIALSSLLAASVTAFAGPVSFVGIAVPFLVKTLLGSSKPVRVVPACFVGGAVFCLGCDLIARTLFSPVELSLSAVTAVFGVPVVLVLMLRRGERG